MPEVYTKHANIVIELLEDLGAECGRDDLIPQILLGCPIDRFCKLPRGEICVLDRI